MNSLSFAVLRALSDGAFHSGATLARTLGVTRGTVWNAVRAIERAGLEVYSVRGRGYRLAESVSLLDRESVARQLGPHAVRFQIELRDVLDSTNTHLIGVAASASPGAVVAAELQSAGRGRMGRTWHSSVAGALTFSLLWRFEAGAGALAGLSLAVGVALVRALTKLGATDVRLKWPNDLVANGAKLGGILIEMQGDALGPSAAVIGIGLNVKLSVAMRGRIDQPATDLVSLCPGAVDRNAVLAVALAELAAVLDVFSEHGFKPLKAEWERAHALDGEAVVLRLPTGHTEDAVVRGVTDAGALLVEKEGSLVPVHSAEISVRASSKVTRASSEDELLGRRV
jgi:BirA family transcriptional regulator, biotin operon repressor / biotin---[acetyl-CoA-carboxylase] ligase